MKKKNYFVGLKAGFLTGVVTEILGLLIGFATGEEIIISQLKTIFLETPVIFAIFSVLLIVGMGILFLIFGLIFVFLYKHIPIKNIYYKSLLFFIAIELITGVSLKKLDLMVVLFSVFNGLLFAFLYTKFKK